MTNSKSLLFIVFLCSFSWAIAQPSTAKHSNTIAPGKPNAAEIYEQIQKLNVLASVLYIAAHPDDENTRLLSYFANDVKARTAYLSVTRGDGGQNLIGAELSELLGVIRTHELLEARKTDGGEQWFTRANDFGYSKHPDETFAIWDKEEVLSDIVLTIRRLQPDIIINRFDHRTPGSTHGHHTGSAILGLEAFQLAGDKNAFPEHINIAGVWQPKRLFFNQSWWFYGSREAFEEANKETDLIMVNTGTYYTSHGLSNGEIAAFSRSKHQSQGFGSTGNRGEEREYLEHVYGDFTSSDNNLFEGIDTSWNRIEGGETIGNLLQQVERDYDFKAPAKSLPKLLEAYRLLKTRNDYWGVQKTAEIKDVIAACAGFFIEATANTQTATPGAEVRLQLEVIQRSPLEVQLTSVRFENQELLSQPQVLNNNVTFRESVTTTLSEKNDYTSPYWLNEKGSTGLYRVDELYKRGTPETKNPFPVVFTLQIGEEEIAFERNLVYKYNSAVTGEVYEPFQLLPKATIALSQKVLMFATDSPRELNVTVTAHTEDLTATVFIEQPEGWQVSVPQNLTLQKKGEAQTLTFLVTPPKTPGEGVLKAKVQIGSQHYDKTLTTIDYPHIPLQRILLPAETKVAKTDLKISGKHIGYIEGAGDAIPASLEQIGYQVTIIAPENINAEHLRKYDAVIMGIRAYNVVNELNFRQEALMDYVAAGGNLIVQYNVSRGLVNDQPAPFPMQLSRDRVTDENSPVSFLNPNHRVLQKPNIITEKDFEGWVQERGLYFPNNWSEEFTPLLRMNDPGETAVDGALLIAPYGKGHYVYTGLSFFRQLPAGVSGAYRLFVNLLSLKTE